ncbi:MAG: QueT transporter family protein [Ruminococcaceae bacterium]|nr:QueT transporter family protein [Oscillospiraceae bacterium]
MKTQKASNRVHSLAVAGLIAGLYTALTVALAPFSFGMVQCRVAETLTVLAAYSPQAGVGLTVGCALSNLIGLSMGANMAGALDVLLGTLATGLAAWLSYRLRSIRWGSLPVLSTLPPVVTNALIVGTELTLVVGPATWQTWFLWAGSVALGQLAACVVGGLVLAKTLETSRIMPFLTGKSYTDR